MADKTGKLRTHEESRMIVCSCCGKKDLGCFRVTEQLEAVIKQVFQGYDVKDVYYLSGICGLCRKILLSVKKGKIVPVPVRARWLSHSLTIIAQKPL